MGNNTNKWTKSEDEIIIDNYQLLSDEELVELLPGRTKNSIYARRRKLGLHKTSKKYTYDDVIAEMDKRNYILLSGENEYKNSQSKMRYICPKHRDKGEQKIDLGHLHQGRGCYYCGRERTISAKTKSINKVEDKRIVNSKGLEYIDTKRENGKIYIYFICPKHRELGIQSMYQWYMLEKAVGCQYCHGHTLPEWYVMKKIEEINPDIELLEPYENMSKRIKCRCKKHDYISTKSVQEILLGRGCKYCGAEKLSEQHFLSNEEVQLRVYQKHPHIKLLYYDGIHSKDSLWLCTKHNKQFNKVLSQMLCADESGCDECYKERMRRDFAYTQEEFVVKLKQTHPDLELVSEYINMTTPVVIYCKAHDHKFQTMPQDVLSRISCCPKSFKTYKEEYMCSLIESWGYDIERQYSFDECKDINILKFDCYLTKYNTVIEYDGENHYFPVKFGTQSWDEAVKKHEYTKKHDEIKNNYCIKNHINLIRVPYFEFENIDSFLFDKFVKLGIIEEIKIS